MNLGREDHRRPAVRRFTDDLDIPLFAEQPRQALANDDMIVGKKDPDFPGAALGDRGRFAGRLGDRCRGGPRYWGRRRRRAQGGIERKAAALAGGAVDFHSSAQKVQPLANAEQAEAARGAPCMRSRAGSNPAPLSETVIRMQSFTRLTSTRAVLALECLTALNSSSRTDWKSRIFMSSVWGKPPRRSATRRPGRACPGSRRPATRSRAAARHVAKSAG